MEDLLKSAVAAGNTHIIYGVLFYMLVRDVGPFLVRKMQGKNGNASLRGQMDKIERLAEATHDMVISMIPELERDKKDIHDIFDRCERRHFGDGKEK